MRRYLFLLMGLLLLVLLPGTGRAAGNCLGCHRRKTPQTVRVWEKSAHAAAGIGCAACHGSDHRAIRAGRAVVDAAVCGRCHAKELRQHERSRHGLALHSGWGCTRNQRHADRAGCRFCHRGGSTRPLSTVMCARFLKQTPAVRALGCNRCHQIERSCAACHTDHATNLAIVRNPNVCATCHMGPDHPQWALWQTSKHGTLYASAGAELGPTCQVCHMPAGSHDVSAGVTATPGGKLLPPAQRRKHREEMVRICTRCHVPTFARRELARGDAIRQQSAALVEEAAKIIRDLNDRGLLRPMPADRPPHPLRGRKLVLDGQMLYEDTSHIERLFFKMKKYDLARTVMGAYHQNPAYTHWYGNAELKMDLVDIRSEAFRLRRLARDDGRGSGAAFHPDDLEAALRALKNKFDRGALSAKEYARRKGLILEKLSAPAP